MLPRFSKAFWTRYFRAQRKKDPMTFALFKGVQNRDSQSFLKLFQYFNRTKMVSAIRNQYRGKLNADQIDVVLMGALWEACQKHYLLGATEKAFVNVAQTFSNRAPEGLERYYQSERPTPGLRLDSPVIKGNRGSWHDLIPDTKPMHIQFRGKTSYPNAEEILAVWKATPRRRMTPRKPAKSDLRLLMEGMRFKEWEIQTAERHWRQLSQRERESIQLFNALLYGNLKTKNLQPLLHGKLKNVDPSTVAPQLLQPPRFKEDWSFRFSPFEAEEERLVADKRSLSIVKKRFRNAKDRIILPALMQRLNLPQSENVSMKELTKKIQKTLEKIAKPAKITRPRR